MTHQPVHWLFIINLYYYYNLLLLFNLFIMHLYLNKTVFKKICFKFSSVKFYYHYERSY